jgi:hypothetical protein
VSLNGRKLGVLQDDERDKIRLLPVPADVLRNGTDAFEIHDEIGKARDNIEVLEMQIEPTALAAYLTQASVSVQVSSEHGAMPVFD